MIVDQQTVDFLKHQTETMDSKKAQDLRKMLRHTNLPADEFFKEACQGKEQLQQVIDDLLIDNPPDRTAPAPGARGSLSTPSMPVSGLPARTGKMTRSRLP